MLKSWKVALLLSVIVPMGMLATFRLGGILKEPLTISENKTLEAVLWGIERPSGNIDIKDSIGHVYSGDITFNSTLFMDDYNANKWAYGGSDCVTIQPIIAASVKGGFIVIVNVSFWEGYENSQIHILGSEAWSQFARIEGLSITRYDHMRVHGGSNLKAFLELAGANNPKGVYFDFFANWVLRSPQNYTHQLEVRFELIYFNGTTYKRVVQPFLLKMGPDDNNSFEKAREIAVNGTYSMLYIGPNDVDDYYKVYLNEGCTFTIQLSEWLPLPIANCDLELYSSDGKLATYSAHNYTHTLTYPINRSGYWFIRVHQLGGFGFYTLTLETTLSG